MRTFNVNTSTEDDYWIIVNAAHATLAWFEEELSEFSMEWSKDANTRMMLDIEKFAASNAADLEGMELDQIGHDFALTRNGHDSGFWDRGLGARGDRLTESAHAFGEIHGFIINNTFDWE